MCALKNTIKDELIAIVKKLDKKAKKYKKTNQSRISNKIPDTKIDQTLNTINHNELKSKRTNGDIDNKYRQNYQTIKGVIFGSVLVYRFTRVDEIDQTIRNS